MKKFCFLLICLSIIIINSYTNDDYSIVGQSGYQLDLSRVNEDSETSIPGYDGSTVDEIDRWLFDQYVYLNLNFSYLNFLDIQVDFSSTMIGENANELESSLSQLYLKLLPFPWMAVVFGKQKLKWGTAKVFNSIDKLEEVIDPFNLKRVRDGVDGIKVVIIPNEWLGISLLALPNEQLRYSQYGLRFEALVVDTDVGFGFIKYNYNYVDDIVLTASSGSIVPLIDTTLFDRYAGFFDFVHYFDSFGIYGECEVRYSEENQYAFIGNDFNSADVLSGVDYHYINKSNLEEFVFKATCGIDIQFETAPYINIILEYFYNSEGFSREEALDFIEVYTFHNNNYDDYQCFVPEKSSFGNFRKHYLYLGINDFRLSDYVNTGISFIANIETLAVEISPSISIKIENAGRIAMDYSFYQQFTDPDDNPSDFFFLNKNHTLNISLETSF